MGLSLLAYASIPVSFWDHAFVTAVQLINILPSTAHKPPMSPHQALYKKQPTYDHLRVFGCSVYSFLRPYNKHKLHFRSEEYVNLGLSPQHKGYKCSSPTGRIFITKHLIFDETMLPYTTLFPTKSTDTPSNPIDPPMSLPTPLLNTTIPDSSSHSPSPPIPPLPNTVTSPDTTLSTPSSTTATSSPTNPTATKLFEPLPAPSTAPHPPPTSSTHPMLTRTKTGKTKPKIFAA